MEVLVIIAHPKAGSFSHALADALIDGLGQGDTVAERRDLCADGFSPVMTAQDMARDPPPDVAAEMARVARAAHLVFVFPVWWWSVPAVLKGWFDRVLRPGWAWSDAAGFHSELHRKTVLMLATTADSPAGFAGSGAAAGLHQALCDGVWGFCGVEAAQLQILHDVRPGAPDETLEAHLKLAGDLGRGL